MSVKYIESLASLRHGIDGVEKLAIAEAKKKPAESFGGERSQLSNWFRTENSENGSFGDKPFLEEEKEEKTLWNKAEKQGLHLSGALAPWN